MTVTTWKYECSLSASYLVTLIMETEITIPKHITLCSCILGLGHLPQGVPWLWWFFVVVVVISGYSV